MKRLFASVFVFIFSTFFATAEFDIGTDFSLLAIRNAELSYDKIHGVSISNESTGNFIASGGIGFSAHITYFWNDLNNDLSINNLLYGDTFTGIKAPALNTFQTGIYANFRFLQEYWGNATIKKNYHFDQSFSSGSDYFYSIGFDGRINFSQLFFADICVGFFLNVTNFDNSKATKFDFWSVGAEVGGDIGFRFLNSKIFAAALCIGTKIELGYGIGDIQEENYEKSSHFETSDDFSLVAFAGLRLMIK